MAMVYRMQINNYAIMKKEKRIKQLKNGYTNNLFWEKEERKNFK